MIDLHCHLLPGIDDGPSDVGSSIALAEAQVAAGVHTVACTPHVDWEMLNDAPSIFGGVERLREHLKDAGVPLAITVGAEVGLTRAAELSNEELSQLTLGAGRWLLLEAPLNVSAGVEQAVSLILMRGHRILLGHPERAPAFQRDPEALKRLVAAGVLCQVTAGALVGVFGSTVKRYASSLMREGLVHVVASDAHNTGRRPPGLREYMVEAGYEDRVQLLTQSIPAAILAGERIPTVPPLLRASRSRWFRRG